MSLATCKMYYKKTQHAYILYIISIIILAIQWSIYFIKLDRIGKVSISLYVILSIVFISVCLVFGRLTINMNEDEISASFGLKFLVQKMKIKEIDPESIEVLKPSLLYGIGLRLTPKGTLYNTKPSKAIRIKSKDGKKTFFVGTSDAEILKEKIIEQLS